MRLMAQQEQDTGHGRTFGTIAILDCDPELAEDLSAPLLAVARRQILAEAISYPAGPWEVGPDDFESAGSLGLLVLEGLLAREVSVGDFTGVELVGPGDLIQPWLRIGPEESVAVEVDWDVVEPLTVAVLDARFCERTARWPEVLAAIARRLMMRTHWLAFHLAVCGLRRVDDRLLSVLWHFADRWGTVTPDGVRLDVRLTHETLAAVTGARRPSVTTALKRLADAGRVYSLPRSRWLLLGSPPAELRTVHARTRRGRKESKATDISTVCYEGGPREGEDGTAGGRVGT
jgi:CRP/FNR family transcriptional regulator, cyclic AMP receptor protein